MRRWIKWLLILAVLGGAAAAAAGPGRAWYAEKSRPHYLTVAVDRGSLETVVNSTGTVKPVKTISVGSFVSGPILKIYVDFNDRIEKGQRLARINPKLFQAAVKRDEASLNSQIADKKRVEALLKQAERNEKRARDLRGINKDYLSDTELDQVRFTRESLEAQRDLATASIAQARANLENSKVNLEYTEIISPVDGIVIERKVDDGQTVASSFQTPEMFIVAPSMEKEMYVFASVDEADIGLIHTAQTRQQPVRFTVDAYPHDLFTAKIHQIRKNSTTTQNVVTFPVVISTPNPDLKLMPGMTANITFLIDSRDNVVRIPVPALRFVPPLAQVHPDDRHYLEGTDPAAAQSQSGVRQSAKEKVELAKGRSKRIVWVQKELWLRAVPIVLGASNNQYAELISGELTEGSDLVTGIQTATPGAHP